MLSVFITPWQKPTACHSTIRSALDNHSSRELETLSGRLKESDISDDRHVRWFREVVDDRMEELKRELASKYLLSAPVVIAPKNKN